MHLSMNSEWIPRLVLLLFIFHQYCPMVKGKSFEEDLTLTYKQKVLLDKFRDIVVSQMPHEWMKQDVFLIRWLRARDYDLKGAENMLLEYVQWRAENKMDDIFNEDWAEFREQYKFHLESRDKEGRPLLYIPGGDWDIRRAIVSGKGPKLLRYIDMGLEEACATVRSLGEKYKNVSQGVAILNVDGFNPVQHACIRCIPFILRVVVALEQHHPGCSEKIILVNVPAIAEPIVNAARGVFSRPTNEALVVLGTNKVNLQRTLLKFYDKDQLPVELGGTKLYKGDLDYDITDND